MEPEGGFEIIVADGMTEDGTREILERFASSPQPNGPSVRIIDNPVRITSVGLNAAIGAARGEIIIRMDAHTKYAPDYVRECVATLYATGADNVGGPARTESQTYLGQVIAAAYHSPFAVGGARFHNVNYEGPVDTVTYGCWPRRTFETFGLFDEELVRNQDDEHNLRITRGGGKIYQSPRIKSWYRPRGSLGALFKQYMQYGYWKVRVIQKHRLPAAWRHLVPGAFVLTLAVLFLLSIFYVLDAKFFRQSPIFHPLSSYLLIGTLGLYSTCVLAASLFTAGRTRWKLLPILPLAFYCYHIGYGIGFLRGFLDFVVLRRAASKSFNRITRRPEPQS